MVEAFYLPLEPGRYRPTTATESPWDREAQHGGPPTALLAHEIDAQLGDGLRVGRVSVDFLAPIPRRELTIEISPLKPGRRVSLAEARMMVDGRAVAIARTWHIALGPRPPASGETQLPAPALPDSSEDAIGLPGMEDWGYGRAVEWRFTHGGFDVLGAADAWTRVRIPLVAGLELTAIERALIVADSANGLSAVLPMTSWFSIPPGITITLLRPPATDWVHVASRTVLAGDGIGMAQAELTDTEGYIGAVAQPLLVQQR